MRLKSRNSGYSSGKLKQETRELGFGTSGSASFRLLNADGSFNLRRSGLPWYRRIHIYHTLLGMRWSSFFALLFSIYLIANVFFALIYLAIGVETLTSVQPGSLSNNFFEAFFFSTQSLTTVGYGRIAPIGFLTSAVAAIESMIGILLLALMTGLLYGRFSKPDARIIFSSKALIAPYKNINAFEFRIVNQRSNQLLEVEVQLLLAINKEFNGRVNRTYNPLKLETGKINFFPLPWTIVHPIDGDSPLINLNENELRQGDAEFIIMVKAFDDTFCQNVYKRYSYKYSDMVWGAKFEINFGTDPDGVTHLHLDRFHHYAAVPLNEHASHRPVS